MKKSMSRIHTLVSSHLGLLLKAVQYIYIFFLTSCYQSHKNHFICLVLQLMDFDINSRFSELLKDFLEIQWQCQHILVPSDLEILLVMVFFQPLGMLRYYWKILLAKKSYSRDQILYFLHWSHDQQWQCQKYNTEAMSHAMMSDK